jgi:dTDP-L-rhamnose 4-epimerase
MKVLVRWRAGFICAHAANELLKHRHAVRVFDSLVPQVHGPERKRPTYLNRDVELIVGDIRDADIVGE